jgi:hypothetical protein
VRFVISSTAIIKFVPRKLKICTALDSEILSSKSIMHADRYSADLEGSRSLMQYDLINNNNINPAGHCVDGYTHSSQGGVIRGFGGYRSEVYEAISTAFLGLGLVGGEYFNRGKGSEEDCSVSS